MLKQEQRVSLNNINNETALALVYQAMQFLKWEVLSAADNNLLAATPKSWKTKGQHVICSVEGRELIIRSEMIYGEMIDIGGMNKKNVARFMSAFEEAKSSTANDIIENNKQALHSIKESTIKLSEQHQQEAVELDEAMNLSGSNLYVTYTIIAINVLVFILMAINGAGIFEANGLVHIKWGSNYTALTLSGDWWRLFTSTFIHFGIFHLAMNMYCLYTVGIYLEPMLGKIKYICAYICTGVLACIASLYWHSEGVNSAGASGAIFGVYGLFLALLTSSLIPKKAREDLLKNIGIFVAYNLIYGMKSGVDNAAHVGGLLSGFVIGLIYVFAIKKEKQEDKKLTWVIPAVLLLTVAVTYGYLQKNTVSASQRKIALEEVNAASYTDSEKFNEKLAEFDKLHQEVNDIQNDSTMTDEKLVTQIETIGLPKLQQAEQMISAATKYDISASDHVKATKLLEYIGLRKEELGILKKMAETKSTDELLPQLTDIRTRAYAIFESITK